MKKLLITILLGLSAFIIISPRLLQYDKINTHILSTINQTLGTNGKVEKIDWQWFPYPYLQINNFTAETPVFSVYLPELQIFPDIKSILYHRLIIGKIKALDPTFELKTLSPEQTSKTKLAGDFSLLIENGTLILPDLSELARLDLQLINLTKLNGEVACGPNRLKFNLKAKTPFAEEIAASGRIDLNNSYYRLKIDNKKFNLAKLLTTAKDLFTSMDSQVDFNALIEGVSLNNFKLSFNGTLPSLRLHGLKDFDLKMGHADKFTVSKYGNDFFINANNLTLQHPSLILDGSLSKRSYPEKSEPVWDIDLSAEDLNAEQGRNFVLSQWGDNYIAQIVCNIVLGGTAKSASYVFNGELEDFEHLSNMKIWFDALNVPIFLEDLPLKVDAVSGSFSIIDGYLKGQNLLAEMPNSTGKNGSIVLQLNEAGNEFHLDLDLDVDAGVLHKVLHDIVDFDDFQEELSHFTAISGRAQGHLSLGDNLDEVDTTVLVKNARLTGSYNRTPWNFKINRGKLSVFPDSFHWQDVSGALGPHKVNNFSGEVDWQEEIKVVVSAFEGHLDSANLFEKAYVKTASELCTLDQYLSGCLTEISGDVYITSGFASGLVNEFPKWQYKADFQAENLLLHSKLLPERISFPELKGHIDNNSLLFESNSSIFDQKLAAFGDYKHDNFKSWRGTLGFSGTIQTKLYDWVKTEFELPASFDLKLPFIADKIKLTSENFSLKNFKLTGNILPVNDHEEESAIKLEIERQLNQSKSIFTINSNKETGHFAYSEWSKPSKKSLLSWEGTISKNSLDCFFNQHPIVNGQIKGVFSILTEADHLDKTLYSGYLEANELKWKKRKAPMSFSFSPLRLNGIDNEIILSKGDIVFDNGEHASLNGKIKTVNKSFDLDLILTSKQLQSDIFIKSIKELTGNKFSLEEPEINSDDIRENRQSAYFLKKITGRIEFSVDSFLYSTKTKTQKDVAEEQTIIASDLSKNDQTAEKTLFPWQNVIGEAQLDEQGDVNFDISSAQICGLDGAGEIALSKNVLNTFLYFNDTENLNFKDTLPCLGFDQSLIEGGFTLYTEFSGQPQNWRSGKLTIKSSNGIIRRMELLSKIFSVINFTEILTFRDLPNFDTDGLQYNDLLIEGHIEENKLIISKANLKGKGLNITCQGSLDLQTFDSNFTVFVAPFKMLDSVVTSIPLVGRIIGGKKGAILTFPVKVEGPIDNPNVTPLSPKAIGKATLDFITETLALPFAIFTPFMQDDEEAQKAEEQLETTTETGKSEDEHPPSPANLPKEEQSENNSIQSQSAPSAGPPSQTP